MTRSSSKLPGIDVWLERVSAWSPDRPPCRAVLACRSFQDGPRPVAWCLVTPDQITIDHKLGGSYRQREVGVMLLVATEWRLAERAGRAVAAFYDLRGTPIFDRVWAEALRDALAATSEA